MREREGGGRRERYREIKRSERECTRGGRDRRKEGGEGDGEKNRLPSFRSVLASIRCAFGALKDGGLAERSTPCKFGGTVLNPVLLFEEDGLFDK